MTHDELVDRAVRWLLRTKSCGFVIPELVTYAMETPDAFGFQHHNSILVECKASRADFLSDKRKTVRRHPEFGMGNERYYMCNPKLIFPDEMPDKWGLLWVYKTKVRIIVKAQRQNANLKDERTFLYSILRRMKKRGCLK